MIGIRADANGKIASGHIMRCIAIAEQIENSGESVIFITADHFPDALLDEKGFRHICLNSDWRDKFSETEALSACIRDWNINILLIDSYEVTRAYMEALHRQVKIAYIDDLYMFEYSADMVINYAIDADQMSYAGYNGSVQFLLGSRYTPLRKEFRDNRIQSSHEVKNVMITTGGSDTYHMTLKLASEIIKRNSCKDLCFHIVAGGFFAPQDITDLEAICSEHQNIVLHKNVKNMAEIMNQCELAVSAGGTTLAELCACGIPVICFAIADNQLGSVTGYGNHEVMVSLGDIRDNLDA